MQRGSWDRAEPIRRALQAKAAHETGDDVGFETELGGRGRRSRGRSGERLNLLQTIAFQWNWPDKATAVLWMLAENRDAQREALQALYRYYGAQRDTSGLYRTLSRLVAVIPHDPDVGNNFAQISLLLKAETSRARGIARDLHEAHPHDAAFASTYAFALFQSGDLKARSRSWTSSRRSSCTILLSPPISVSCSPQPVQHDAAAEYFGVWPEKAKLLPEEEELVAQAKASLARK